MLVLANAYRHNVYAVACQRLPSQWEMLTLPLGHGLSHAVGRNEHHVAVH